jgi:hypothetical protein
MGFLDKVRNKVISSYDKIFSPEKGQPRRWFHEEELKRLVAQDTNHFAPVPLEKENLWWSERGYFKLWQGPDNIKVLLFAERADDFKTRDGKDTADFLNPSKIYRAHVWGPQDSAHLLDIQKAMTDFVISLNKSVVDEGLLYRSDAEKGFFRCRDFSLLFKRDGDRTAPVWQIPFLLELNNDRLANLLGPTGIERRIRAMKIFSGNDLAPEAIAYLQEQKDAGAKLPLSHATAEEFVIRTFPEKFDEAQVKKHSLGQLGRKNLKDMYFLLKSLRHMEFEHGRFRLNLNSVQAAGGLTAQTSNVLRVGVLGALSMLSFTMLALSGVAAVCYVYYLKKNVFSPPTDPARRFSHRWAKPSAYAGRLGKLLRTLDPEILKQGQIVGSASFDPSEQIPYRLNSFEDLSDKMLMASCGAAPKTVMLFESPEDTKPSPNPADCIKLKIYRHANGVSRFSFSDGRNWLRHDPRHASEGLSPDTPILQRLSHLKEGSFLETMKGSTPSREVSKEEAEAILKTYGLSLQNAAPAKRVVSLPLKRPSGASSLREQMPEYPTYPLVQEWRIGKKSFATMTMPSVRREALPFQRLSDEEEIGFTARERISARHGATAPTIPAVA